jgi:terminase, large subunit
MNNNNIDNNYFRNKINSITETKLYLKVSEWAESKRIIPIGLSPFPGLWQNNRTPYLTEIMDGFSVSDDTKEIVFMKGAQIGATTGILENIIGYIIDHEPAPTMYVSADKGLVESSIELKLDRMLESSGLSHKIFSQSEKHHNKKTGDTKTKKEFPGGFLLAAGANSAAKLRSISIKYLLLDEVDGFPNTIGNEGDPVKIAEKRTTAFEANKKILYISTPLAEETSKIKKLFEQGDQRYFYVPCPHCNHYQRLEFQNLKWQLDENQNLIYDSVYYECEECKKEIKNFHKNNILGKGQWRATAIARKPNYKSYHLNSLYSPAGMLNWETIIVEFIEIKDDPLSLQTFMNLRLGITWEERGSAPKYERIMLRRKDYQLEVVPKDVCFLTLGVDVQENRIECELVGWCKDKISYSLSYNVFEGDTALLNSSSWRKLYDYILTTFYNYNQTKEYNIIMAMIDSSFRTNIVNSFCDQFETGVYPIQGANYLSHGEVFRTHKAKSHNNITRFDLATDLLKDEIYGFLKREISTDNTVPLGYSYFPMEYGEQYFKMLTAEEKKEQKNKISGKLKFSYYLPYKTRNEALDCRVYNLAAVYAYRFLLSQELDLTWKDFWNYFEKK